MIKKYLIGLMLSASLMAGGDLPEIEPVSYVGYEEPQASPFYAGAGIGLDNEQEWYGEYDYNNISLFAGAVVAREGTLGLALEGRVAWSLDDYGVDSWGIYAKPEIDIDSSFIAFIIIGYQNLITYDYTYDAVGVGIGGVFMFTDSVGVQADYIYSFIEEDEFGYTPEYSNLTASILYKF